MKKIFCGTKKVSTLSKGLIELIGEEIKDEPYIELNVTFKLTEDSENIIPNLPIVNVVFEND